MLYNPVQCKNDMDLVIKGSSENYGNIYLGNYKAAGDLNDLKSKKIRAVLSLGCEVDFSVYTSEDFDAHKVIEIGDVESADLSKYFFECTEWIERCREKTNVLIHCMAGISRSSAILIAYLMIKSGMGYVQASKFLTLKRAEVNPNSGFVRQLKDLEKLRQFTFEFSEMNF